MAAYYLILTSWKRQNCGDSKRIIICLGSEREMDEYVEHRGFLGQ